MWLMQLLLSVLKQQFLHPALPLASSWWSETGKPRSRARRLLTEERGLQGRDPCQGVIGGEALEGPGWSRGLAQCDWVWQRSTYLRHVQLQAHGRGKGPQTRHKRMYLIHTVSGWICKGSIPATAFLQLAILVFRALSDSNHALCCFMKACQIIAPVRGKNWGR